MSNSKKLKPTSTHFLSQSLWRNLRKILNRNLWTFLYINSQKLKINKLIKNLKENDLSIKKNLNYPKKNNKYIKPKNFNYFLEKYNSSKPLGAYREFLDQFMRKIYPHTILEFGISEGAGIYAMKDYFKNSHLWGCDIDKKTFIKHKKIICGYCDQLNLKSLNNILKKFNTKFDLIVDDGWHHPESQINTIMASLPYLNKNGIYITEDIAHDAYKSNVRELIKILKFKKFKVLYKTFHIKNTTANIAGTNNNGYLIIYRKFK